jgi:hypothetical protein
MTLRGMTATPSSIPIACSLSADALGDRETEWQALLSRALISRTSTPGGLRIALRNAPGARHELEHLVAAERECCPFMTMSVDTTDRELLVLTVTAPELAAPILEQMLAGGGRAI